MLASGSAAADTNGLYLPPAPSGSGGEDSITTPSGLTCRQSLNTGGPILDLGITGARSNNQGNDHLFGNISEDDGFNAIGYARIVIPLGNRPERIDCSEVFELEIERLRKEVELLEAAIE